MIQQKLPDNNDDVGYYHISLMISPGVQCLKIYMYMQCSTHTASQYHSRYMHDVSCQLINSMGSHNLREGHPTLSLIKILVSLLLWPKQSISHTTHYFLSQVSQPDVVKTYENLNCYYSPISIVGAWTHGLQIVKSVC